MIDNATRRRSRKLIMAASLLLLAPILCWRAYNASLIGGVAVNIQSSDLVNGRAITFDSATQTFKLTSVSSASGDVVGPASATDNAVARFDSTTGKLIQNSAVTIDDSGNATGFGTINGSGNITGGTLTQSGATATAPALNITGQTSQDLAYYNGSGWTRFAKGSDGTTLSVVAGALAWTVPVGTGDVVGPASSTDNAIVRFDLTTGKLVQNSAVTIDDAGAATGFTTLNASGQITGGTLTQSAATSNVGAIKITSEARGDLVVRGASDWSRFAIGASGRVLSSNGTDPGWTAYAGDVTGSPGASVISDISIITTQGDLLLGDASGNASRLAIGASGRVFSSNGTTGAWTAFGGDISGAPGSIAVNDISVITTKGDLLGGNGSGNAGRLGVGSDGQVLTADAASTLGFKWAAAGGSSSVDVQTFTSGTGTWTKPANAKSCRITMIAGGAGGGAGRRGATSSTRAGGGGGGGGAQLIFTVSASVLGATENVTVGAGGSGGAAQTSDSSDGAAGSAGGDTIFGSFTAKGGTGGGGGTSSAGGSAGSSRVGTVEGNGSNVGSNPIAGGSSGAPTDASNTNNPIGSAGGGGGGGVTSGNSRFNGGAGGGVSASSGSNASPYTSVLAGGAGGASAGANGTAGISGLMYPGTGGGGGAGNDAGAGGTGGAGGSYGAGGGGGGGSTNGSNSGAGGAGGAGNVTVVTFCAP